MRKFVHARTYTLFFTLMLGLAGFRAGAQTDIDFWFAAPEVSTSNQTFDLPIIIRMTTGNAAATVTISQPAGGGMPNQVVNIPANSTQSVDLSAWLNIIESQPANTVLNYGLRVQSTAPITAYYEVVSLQCLCNPEIFVLKGANALGTDFWIPSQNYLDNNQSYVPNPRSSFDIIATQNNTTVTITPSNDVVGHLAGIAYTVVLNAGQVYSATAANWQAALHLQGSRVTADAPIAITVKDDLLSGTPYGGCADLAGDQIIPTNIIGDEYIAMDGALNAPYDQMFITATQNNTAISRNGILLTTINAGQTYQFDIAGNSCYIQTSSPAYCYQLSGIGCEVGTAVLPQIDCSGSTSVSFNRSSPNDLYINLMVEAGGEGNFLVNGVAGVVTAGMFAVVPGTGGQWLAAQVPLPVNQYAQGSVIRVDNTTNRFHLGVLDGSVSSGARFGYFSDYGGIPSDASTTTYELCEGDDILLFADSIDGAFYQWTGPNNWTSNAEDPVITNATPNMSGTYTLVVTANGCTSSQDTVNITVHPTPNPPVINYVAFYCTNDQFVPFTVNGQNVQYYDSATGGTATSTAPTVDPTVPGTYYWWASQTVNGCEGPRTPIVITVYPTFVADFVFDINYGCAGDTVAFTNTSIGAPNYVWDFGDGSPLDTNANPVHVYDTQGVFTIKLKVFTDNCMDSVEQQVNLVHPLAAAFTTDADTICQNSAITFTDASTYVTTNNITPSYYWSFGDGATSNLQNPVHPYTVSGVYTVSMIITDFVPCMDTVYHTVYVDSTSMVEIMASENPICAGEAVTFTGVYSDIGLNTISWDFGDGIVVADADPARHTYEYAGSYLIKLSTDYRVCRDTTAEYTILVKPHPVINLGPDTAMCPNSEPLVLADLVNAGNANATWIWNTGSTTFNAVAAQPGTYYARVSIDGCAASDTVWVRKDCYLDVPNAFSPDGDNLNDYFIPRQWLSRGVSSFSMTIYNRWGQEVFSTTNIDGRGWDGKFNGVDQPQGVYVYVIQVQFKNGVQEKKQGNVTLLR